MLSIQIHVFTTMTTTVPFRTHIYIYLFTMCLHEMIYIFIASMSCAKDKPEKRLSFEFTSKRLLTSCILRLIYLTLRAGQKGKEIPSTSIGMRLVYPITVLRGRIKFTKRSSRLTVWIFSLLVDRRYRADLSCSQLQFFLSRYFDKGSPEVRIRCLLRSLIQRL